MSAKIRIIRNPCPDAHFPTFHQRKPLISCVLLPSLKVPSAAILRVGLDRPEVPKKRSRHISVNVSNRGYNINLETLAVNNTFHVKDKKHINVTTLAPAVSESKSGHAARSSISHTHRSPVKIAFLHAGHLFLRFLSRRGPRLLSFSVGCPYHPMQSMTSVFRLFVILAGFLAWQPVAAGAGEGWPEIKDPRIDLTLFAEHPLIVTPIGMAIDSGDRIFVIESHTHEPPRDYKGPKGDLVKVFEDQDNDGRADRITTFAEGLDDAMNLAFIPSGELIVACAREVWRLHDSDQDGKSDSRVRLLELRTSNKYSHSALLGVTYGPDGWLYVSRGNNGSARYRLVGTDGSEVRGFGDGGNIVRCRPDGSDLEEFATGFWNPFDLKFDTHGRLIAVDNDPDARGPNRLLHIVPHGDYGYRSIYGGGGNHPYQGWDGDLPGTLGYVAGTGEAPSGVIDCNRAALPLDFGNNYLVTVWNENNVVRFVPRRQGLSLAATNAVLIQGGQDFRPVALNADSKGNLFITDWVKVDYPNHGFGRIWRLAPKKGVETLEPHPAGARPLMNPDQDDFNALMNSSKQGDLPRLKQALDSSDPFARHAAVLALARPQFQEPARGWLDDVNSRVRLGALLALRRAALESPQDVVRKTLRDPDEDVRRAALIWIGEEGLVALKADLPTALAFESVSPVLLETWLATTELLDPGFIEQKKNPEVDKASSIRRTLDQSVLLELIQDKQRSAQVRALALTHLKEPDEKTLSFIRQLAKSAAPELQQEAIRSLAQAGGDHVSLLEELALDRTQPEDIRAEALLALAGQRVSEPSRLIPLLKEGNEAVRLEAARTLRFYAEHQEVKKAFQEIVEQAKKGRGEQPLVEQAEFALNPPQEGVSSRPATLKEWQSALESGGNPAAGRRVFFSMQTQCSACHLVNNRGRRVGPELSNIAQSLSREQIIHSILKPSDQFAPQYQAWFVELKSDEYYQGFQLDHKSGGAIELYTTEAKTRHFKGSEIARYGIQPNSLMPDGLEQTMTVSELRDLVAFLASLK